MPLPHPNQGPSAVSATAFNNVVIHGLESLVRAYAQLPDTHPDKWDDLSAAHVTRALKEAHVILGGYLAEESSPNFLRLIFGRTQRMRAHNIIRGLGSALPFLPDGERCVLAPDHELPTRAQMWGIRNQIITLTEQGSGENLSHLRTQL
jgi:hypothetical protein